MRLARWAVSCAAVLLTIVAAAVGVIACAALFVLLGLLVHNVFVVLLAGLVSAELPPPGPWLPWKPKTAWPRCWTVSTRIRRTPRPPGR